MRLTESWATEDIQDRTKNRIDGLKGRTKDAVESASEVFRRRDKNIKGYTGVGIKSSVPSFPWAFTVAVQIDSLVDGMLLGLATVTGESAGVFMALALSFEMGQFEVYAFTSVPWYFFVCVCPCV